MWFVYLPASLLALIIAVKLFGFYERDVCTTLLCWVEAVLEKRMRKRFPLPDVPGDPPNFFTVQKTRLR